jgi:hypothetical protein
MNLPADPDEDKLTTEPITRSRPAGDSQMQRTAKALDLETVAAPARPADNMAEDKENGAGRRITVPVMLCLDPSNVRRMFGSATSISSVEDTGCNPVNRHGW